MFFRQPSATTDPVSTALLLFPDFALILIGSVLHRYGGFDEGFWRNLERLVYFVLFPALLFLSTATVKLDLSATTGLILTGWAASASGFAFGLLAMPLFRPDPLLFASGVQTAYRFNSYIALAIAGRLADSSGIALMALLIGFNVPLLNAASVLMLARHRKTNVLREMARNPLIIATVSGLAFNLLGLSVPEFGALILNRLGSASIALGLIAVGAGLRIAHGIPERAMVAWFLAAKLAFMPIVAWLLARHIGLPPLQQQIVLMFAALPTASSAYILAVRMGGNGPIVAFLISAGTLISLASLPLWLSLLRQ